MDSANTRIEELAKEVEHLSSELTLERNNAKELKDKVNQLQQELVSSQDKSGETISQQEALKRNTDELTNQMSDYKKQIEELTNEIQEVRQQKELKEAELANLEKEKVGDYVVKCFLFQMLHNQSFLCLEAILVGF